MLERFGIDQRDLRNMQIVFVIMTLVMSFVIDAPILARFIAALIVALFSAISFLVVTILMKKFGIGAY